MVRTTQDDDTAAAFGCAAAIVLESVVLGSSVSTAVADAHAWLLQQANGSGGHASAVPPAIWRQVAERLQQAAALAHLPPREAVSILGRNCHLPGSLQTPLHVLLHLEWRLASGGDSVAAPAAPSSVHGGNVQKQQLDRTSALPAVGPVQACLPCSMGKGTACELPGPSPAGAAAVAALRQQQQQQQQLPAKLTAAAYQDAVRLAIREGGCCASRAGLVGALAGAALDGGPEALPAEWTAQALGWEEEAAAAEALMQLRD